jgi:hypothetical protein
MTWITFFAGMGLFESLVPDCIPLTEEQLAVKQ